MEKNTTNPIQTTLVICVGCIIIYLLSGWQAVIYIGLSVGLAGIFSPYLSRKIDFVWMKLAWVLSLIIPNIILSLIFYVLLFPVAALAKIFGKNKNPLQLKNNTHTTYIERNKEFDAASFEQPW